MSKKRREEARQEYSKNMKAQELREKRIKLIGAGAVFLVVLGIVGIAVVASNQQEAEVLGSGEVIVPPDVNNVLPSSAFPSGDENEYGALYPYSGLDTYDSSLPTLEVWSDYQCPACAELDAASGDTFKALADQGRINLVYRPAAILDVNRRNDSSQRSINAWGCAIDAGKGQEYKKELYANQKPSRWTNSDFFSYAENAGIEGSELDTFKSCVEDGTYLGWASNGNLAFELNNKTRTPTVVFDGVELDNGIAFNPLAFLDYAKEIGVTN